MLGKIPDEGLKTLLIKSLAHPVERRTEVVHQFLAGERASNLSSKSRSFLDIGVTGLNP